MKNLILGISTLSLLTSCVGEGEQRSPNIVFILADDMGYGDVSFFGERYSKITTKNLDNLAKEGVCFMDAHSSSSVSTPTRYGVLTGRYNWRSTLKNGVLKGYSAPLIAQDRETMASMLRKQGYTTAAIGKWHLGWEWNNIENGFEDVDFSKPIKNGPTTRGFDYFYGISASLDMPPYVYVENDLSTSLPDRITKGQSKYGFWREGPTGSDFRHEEVLPNLIFKACSYITDKAKSDQPYFLYLPLPAPHTPILPIEDYKGKSGLGDYADYVLMVDDMVGKVLQSIRETGEENNTIVVFTTDNGCSPEANFKHLKKYGHYPNAVYRGAKADLFDGGHRVPCILRWPDKVSHHKVNQTICLTDFYATFAAINDYTLLDSEAEDSYNLLPAILSNKEISPIREATVHHSVAGQFTIRKGKWKLLFSASSGGWSFPAPGNKKVLENLPELQLYDMSSDESETRNVVNEYPDIVNELKGLMLKYIDNGRSTVGMAQKNDSEEEWEQLRELKKLLK